MCVFSFSSHTSFVSTKKIVFCILLGFIYFQVTYAYSDIKQTSENCVDLTKEERDELLLKSVYSPGLFKSYICDAEDENGKIYNYKVLFKKMLFKETEFGIRAFKDIAELESCASVNAAYHIYSYFLFNVYPDLYNADLSYFESYIKLLSVCLESLRGMITAKILHIYLFENAYSKADVKKVINDSTYEFWVASIRSKNKWAAINLELAVMLLSGSTMGFEYKSDIFSINLISQHEIKKFCDDASKTLKVEVGELEIPYLSNLEDAIANGSITRKELCDPNKYLQMHFEYLSEW